MTKFFGIVSFTRKNLDFCNFSNELKASSKYQNNKVETRQDKFVCLGQISFESKIEHKTDFDANKTLDIVADASLTNRTELFNKFGILFSEKAKYSDKDLILKSYKKWGENCVEHLVGDFAFAIWDKKNKELFCARDHFGVSPLYFFNDNKKFVFASNPSILFCFDGIEKKLNKSKLATYLLLEPHTLFSNQSWFENVFHFPAGISFTITQKGIRKNKYWTPNKNIHFPYKKEEDILDAFRELFFDIIEARINKNKYSANLLSGGLDSSSIVAVSAKILEKQNKELNVFAHTLENNNDEFEDESYYINQFKTFPNVNINYITTSKTGPFSNLDTLFENLSFPNISSRHYLYTAFFNEANRIGATTIFDGCFGEVGPTSHNFGGFAEMFRNFNWLTLWQELKLRKKLYNDSIKYNIRANVLSPLIPEFIKNLKHGRLKREIPFNKHHSLNKNLAFELMSNTNFEEHLFSNLKPDHRINQVNQMKYFQRKFPELSSSNFGNNPIELRYPLLDKRLIEFSLGVPLSLKFRNGYYRYLIRAGLDKILPPKIQWRTTKKPFSPDYDKRFSSQINIVKQFLEGIKSNDPIKEVVDIEKLKKWAKLVKPYTKPHSYDEALNNILKTQAIYLIYFLRTFPEFRI